MTLQVDLYDGHYSNLEAETYQEIRNETYGEDLGQASWITVEECDRFCGWLHLQPSAQVLEVACGSGGFSAYITQKYDVEVTGVDINQEGINAATERAQREGLTAKLHFQVADASKRLPFPGASFDAVFCNDSINHLPNRLQVLKDWFRLLKPGGRLVYTDPILVTGQLSNEEMTIRSSIGHYLFTPPGINEELLEKAGFGLVHVEDVTANVTLTAGRWHTAREKRKDVLLQFEDQERYDRLQQFLRVTSQLAREGRLSRHAFVARRGIKQC